VAAPAAGSVVLQCLKSRQMALSAPCHDAVETTGVDVK
jgi:hypothetical protein